MVTVDFREMAPRSATPTMYLGPDGQAAPALPRPAPGRPACRGPSAAWPWLTRGWGRRPWAELVRPAARLAREGFPISADLAGSLNRQLGRVDPDQSRRRAAPATTSAGWATFPRSVAAFGKPDGKPWHAGDRLVQADLAATLDRIAAGGADEFYTGRTAELIARYMEEHGGFITPGRPEILRGQAPAAGPHHVPRLRRLQHRARRPRAA